MQTFLYNTITKPGKNALYIAVEVVGVQGVRVHVVSRGVVEGSRIK